MKAIIKIAACNSGGGHGGKFYQSRMDRLVMYIHQFPRHLLEYELLIGVDKITLKPVGLDAKKIRKVTLKYDHVAVITVGVDRNFQINQGTFIPELDEDNNLIIYLNGDERE